MENPLGNLQAMLSGWCFGTMEFYDFPSIGNFIIPTDELHDFSEGLRKTTKQLFFEEVGSTMKSLRGIRQTAASSTHIHL